MAVERRMNVRDELRAVSEEISTCSCLANLMNESVFEFEMQEKHIYTLTQIINTKLEQSFVKLIDVREALFGPNE